jgi:ubiquinone/menaquinone biosynthesis C-methylase UbiE
MQLNKIAEIPFVYEFIQWFFGRPMMDNILKKECAKMNISSDSRILDLGGGTGLNRSLFKNVNSYINLDIDYKKLHQSQAGKDKIDPVLANAIRIPLKTDSIDLLLLTAVTHHIPDEFLSELLSEVHRVLAQGGRFLLYDPVFSRNNLFGVFFWKFDLGAYPRTKLDLLDYLSVLFIPNAIIDLKIIHSYLVFSGICKSIND